MFCFLQHFRILNAPSWLHDHVDPRLEALGKVDKYQFVPGARGDASQGPWWLCCQLSNHFPKSFHSLQYNLLVCNITHLKNIVLLLRFWARSHAVTSCQPWPASSARRWHQADRKLTQAASESPILESVKGWPAKVMVKILGEVALYSDILRITEVQNTTFIKLGEKTRRLFWPYTCSVSGELWQQCYWLLCPRGQCEVCPAAWCWWQNKWWAHCCYQEQFWFARCPLYPSMN